MTTTARVARTAKDLDHVNRLHHPDFWILDLHLEIGAKTSKPYLTEDAPKPDKDPGGTDEFHFAPETETVSICYELDDSRGRITVATLEIFRRFAEKPLVTIDLEKVGTDIDLHGKHVLKWDGRVFKEPDAPQAATETDKGVEHDLTKFDADGKVNATLPDGYVTLEHTPYKLKLTVSDEAEGTAGRRVRTAWTYFQILVKKIELELGPKDALPAATGGKPDLDAQVYDDTDPDALNGALPAADAAAPKKILLTSNIYKNSNGQMHNQADFTAYRDLWGDGPNIPVFAKIWISDSNDAEVECPKALGKVKFLWDAVDVPEKDGSVFGGHHAKAKTFVEDAANYLAKKSHPKGDNCHKDRGGKRGDDSKFLFPKQTGYGYGHGGDFDSDPKQDALKAREFPFKVVPCKTRKWSAFSYAWTKGTLASKTGVLFQPSRMAGDSYKLTVYLAYDRKLDGKKESIVLDTETDEDLDKVDKIIKKSTGKFEIWRRLNFVNYMQKNATVTPAFAVATFQNYYKQAYVQVEYTAGAAVSMTKADYDGKMATATAGLEWYKKLMLSDPVAVPSQYDAGNHGVDFREFADFKDAVKADKGWDDDELDAFLGTVLDTDAKYVGYCDGIASDALTSLCESYMAAADGINLFQFNEHYNLATRPGGSTLNGFAPGAAVGPKKADPTNPQCFFVLCAGPTNYDGTNNKAEQTVTHEIGHCLFMAHAPVQTATDDANKHDRSVHDKGFNNCTMSYNYDAERKWCGFCILRLRGWDRGALRNEASRNKKT